MKNLLKAFILWGFASGAYAADVILTWERPTIREDGSSILNLDGYEIQHTLNNVEQGMISVEPDKTEFTLVNAQQGTHTFLIRAIESGLAGEYSNPAQASIVQAKIGPMTITIEVK